MSHDRARTAVGLPLLLLLVVAAACNDELPQITEIEGLRVVGAQATVVDAGDGRATPAAGDTVEVAFQLVSPDPLRDNRRVRSIFLDCSYPTRFTGLPLCQEFFDLAAQLDPDTVEPMEGDLEPIRCVEEDDFFFEGVHGACVEGDPTAEVEVRPGGGAVKLVRGVICDDGQPFFDARLPELFGCELKEGGTQILVHGSVPTEAADGAGRNHNPSFDDIALSLNGRPWGAVDPADLPPADDCRDAAEAGGLLAIDAFDHELWIEVPVDAPSRELADGVPEDLEFSLYASAGEVGRRFTVFEGTDGGEDGVLRATVPWVAPDGEDVPEGGQLVTLYLTVIDRRGGFDMAVRHACVFQETAIGAQL